MKFIRIPIPVFLVLFVAAILVLNSTSTSICQHHMQFSSSPLLLFSLFNTIILAIIVGSYRPSAEQVEVALPCFQFPYEGGRDTHDRDEDDYNHDDDYDSDEYYGSDYDYDYNEYYDSDDYNENNEGYYGSDDYYDDYDEYYGSDDYNEDDDRYYGSDGYFEDDDDNGSDDEIGWQDEKEEYDDNLQKRIEDFIEMVNNGWREERLKENFHDQFQ